MPKCTDETVQFGRVGRRVVEAALDGGDIVSDGGVLLLKRLDDRLGLTRAAAVAFGDERRSARVRHSVHSLLAQRIYGLPLHGAQERGHFHACYDNCCYLRLYAFVGQDMQDCRRTHG